MLLLQRLQTVWQIETKRYQKKGKTATFLAFSLFFFMIWFSLLIGKQFWPQSVEDKGSFVFYGEIIIHTITLILSFLIYLPGYMGWASSYEKFKINKDSKWPWERENWNQVLKKMILNIILNEIIIYPLVVYTATSMGIKQRFTDFPSFWELLTHLLIIYFLEDFFFYWGHRLFHQVPLLYRFHKVHHEYDKVFTVATEYFHPVDLILGNVVPSALAMIILGRRVHCFTYFFWIAYKVMLGNEGHAGYEIPWTPLRILPLVSGPSFHDHHHSMNVGCYAGSCYLWDVLLGTSEHYFKGFLNEKIERANVQ